MYITSPHAWHINNLTRRCTPHSGAGNNVVSYKPSSTPDEHTFRSGHFLSSAILLNCSLMYLIIPSVTILPFSEANLLQPVVRRIFTNIHLMDVTEYPREYKTTTLRLASKDNLGILALEFKQLTPINAYSLNNNT